MIARVSRSKHSCSCAFRVWCRRVVAFLAVSVFVLVLTAESSAQTHFVTNAACTYYNHEIKEALYLFNPDRKMRALIKEMASAADRPRNFSLFGANVSKVVAARNSQERYLLYDQFTFSMLDKSTVSERWAALAMLAHQMGHHLSNHPLSSNETERPESELEADRFSGFVLRKMGASLEDAQTALRVESETPISVLYPSKQLRLKAVGIGWREQRGNQTTFPFVSEDEFPQFPWPPPVASASTEISSQILVADSGGWRLVDIADRLQDAFDEAGYVEKRFFAVPKGFAMVSRLEQISPDGRPKPDSARWSVKVQPHKVFSLGSYLRALLTSNPGYYRLVVFVVTSTPFNQGAAAVDFETARDWLRQGFNRLPPSVGIQKYTDHHSCTALVYEFEQRTADVPALFKDPSSLTARKHLEQARLWQALVH